jgi:carboxyl-terminal processing protease
MRVSQIPAFKRVSTVFALSLALVGAQAQAPITGPIENALAALAQAQAPPSKPISAEAKKEVLDRINQLVLSNAFVPGVDFKQWPTMLEDQLPGIEKAESVREFHVAVNNALKKFGFSHIVLISPEAAQARMTRQSVGIGVQLQLEDEGLRVLSVFDGSPAAKAGLEPGDIILEGDGKKAQSPLDLAGEENTQLRLKVRKMDGKTLEYVITRAKFSNVRPETLTWVNPETAVLKVHTFDMGYSRNLVEEHMKAAKGAKNLILDLRSNGGGMVANLTHLMGHFVPRGTAIGTFVSRSLVDRYVKETNGSATDLAAIAKWSSQKITAAGPRDVEPFKGNVAVLVNGGSGSASEIAAAALSELRDAPIIGTKSAGAVLVSIMAPLPHGFMLQYPVTDYVTPKGVRLEGNGVVPVAETSAVVRFGQPDEGIAKAVEILQTLAQSSRSSGSR